MGPAQHAVGKPIQDPSNTARTQSSQELKGCKLYSLPMLLFLFCLNSYFIKPFITVPFLLRSRQNPASSLSLSHLLTTYLAQSRSIYYFYFWPLFHSKIVNYRCREQSQAFSNYFSLISSDKLIILALRLHNRDFGIEKKQLQGRGGIS